ncbi:ATP synthase F0 subcomplex B subunit [Micrococcales bacterium KH10]|nr:ATP synthase F0 subcomplex B subunit [Micrococcales bacterium KH10]
MTMNLAAGGEPVEGIQLFIPVPSEILWSAITIVIIAVVVYKFFLPKFTTMLDERTELIEGRLAEADEAQAKADALVAEHEEQLRLARTEASKIREEARSEGAQIVAEQREHASDEAARILENAQRQIESERQQVSIALRDEVGTLATELASRIVGESLEDVARQSRVVDRFLDEIEASSSSAKGK